MRPELQAVVGILIAALGGLAVGMERERSGHATGPKAHFAGVRTFTLLGTLSGIAGWMWTQGWQVLAAVLLLGAVALVVAAYIAASLHDVDGTTEVAALVVLAAGLLAGLRHWPLAAGVIAVVTLLLVEKSRLHALARRLDDAAMRAAVRFAIMAVVILPLLPAGPYGPWGGIRPRILWMFVLFFSGLSFFGYIARRTVGAGVGYPLTGLLGGLVSSTSVTLAFSQLSRKEKRSGVSLAAGVIGASTVLFVRVLLSASLLNPPVGRATLPFFAAPFLLGTIATLVGIYRREDQATSDVPTNPLQFWSSLQMAVFFQAGFYAVHWVQGLSSRSSILGFGALLGLVDMDTLTISLARGASDLPPAIVAMALAVGILSDTALKAGIALVLGKGPFRWLTVGGLTLIGIALGASVLFLR